MKPTNQPTNKTSFKTILLFFLSSFLFLPSISSAFDFDGSLKGVTITDSGGTNPPPTAVINYTQNRDTFDFDASGSADSDGSIAEYKWEFGDGTTGSGVTVSHQFADYGNYPVTLAATDDKGGVGISQVTIANSPPFGVAVNFQPADAEVPDGFVVDNALPFDEARGYGWSGWAGSANDRDSNFSPDQSYDTYVLASNTATWEYSISNGTYNVTVCIGDPVYPTSTYNAQVEGISVIDNESLSDNSKWIEKSVTVEVADGRLTVSFKDSASGPRVCWVTINQNRR